MIITTKQIRILAALCISIVWLIYAGFFYGLIVYPQYILGSPINFWSFPEAWTIFWLGVVLIDKFGASSTLPSASRFLAVFFAVVFLLGLLPNVGGEAYSAGLRICNTSCAILGINWVGGIFPVSAGIVVVIAEVHRHKTRSNHRTYRAYLTAIGIALFIAIIFHNVTPQGVISDETYAGLAALPVFFIVQNITIKSIVKSEVHASGLHNLRELFWKAAIVYSILALVYFFADLAALPLLLTPANTVGTNPIWMIGGSGVQDANFLYPMTALISYPLSHFLGEILTSARSRIRLRMISGGGAMNPKQ
jgi:hypothetical protein